MKKVKQMHIGVYMYVTEYSLSAVELAREAEELGFDSVFLPDHTHIPASRITPWPGGGQLPREYSHAFDPFVTLGAIAVTTSRIGIGTGVCLVPQREPIVLAKQVATLDQLSAGRFIFGVGGGWNVEEMRHHGTDPRFRWEVLRERLEAMKEIWTQPAASYNGQFVGIDSIWSWPKPAQQPHPPIWVGGDGPNVLQRVVSYGDAWAPIPNRTSRHLSTGISHLNALASAAGRGPIPTIAFLVPPDKRIVDDLLRSGAAGVVFHISPESPRDARADLMACARIAQHLR